jgi:hypothetical protein
MLRRKEAHSTSFVMHFAVTRTSWWSADRNRGHGFGNSHDTIQPTRHTSRADCSGPSPATAAWNLHGFSSAVSSYGARGSGSTALGHLHALPVVAFGHLLWLSD